MRVTLLSPHPFAVQRDVLARVLASGVEVSAVFPREVPLDAVVHYLQTAGAKDSLVVGHGAGDPDPSTLLVSLFQKLGGPRRTVLTVTDAPLGALNASLSRALGPARGEVLALPVHQFQTENIESNLAYHLDPKPALS